MGDSLADALNRVNADPQAAVAPPVQPAKVPSALSNIARTLMLAVNPGSFVLDPDVQADPIGAMRTLASGVARVPTDIAAGAVGLPAAVDAIYKLGGSPLGEQPLGSGGAALADASGNAFEAVHGVGEKIGEAVAGKPVSDSLLHGTLPELATNWARTLGEAIIPVPAAAAAKIKAGAEAFGTLGKAAVLGTEILTPLTITAKPSAKLVAVNAAVAGSLGAGIEGLIDANTTVAQTKPLIDEKAKGTLDVAAQGGEEAQEHNTRTIQAGFTGDPTYDKVGLAIAAAGFLGYYKRAALYDLVTNARRRMTGLDASNPLHDTKMNDATAVDAQVFDRNVPMVKSYKDVLGNAPNMPKSQANELGEKFAESIASRSGASVDTRLQSAYNYGSLPDSAVKINPISDWYTLYHTLEPAQQDLLSKALHSKREIDTWNIDKVRFNLYDTGIRELEGYVTQALADPKVSHLYRDFLNTTRNLADYAGEQKRFSPAEVKMFTAKNPSFVPERLSDESARYLSQRNISMNGGYKTFEELGNPAEYLPRYLDEVVRSTEGFKIKRDYMGMLAQQHNAGNSAARDLVGRTIRGTPNGSPALPNASKDLYVHWRNAHGESRFTEIKDALVRKTLQDATNPTALQLSSGALSKLTRFYENASVGPLAVMGAQSIFALKSAGYNATFGAALRHPGTAVGWIDKYVQDLTKKANTATGGKFPKFGVPGDVATFVPDMAYRMATNVGAVLSQRAGRVLHDSIVRGNPYLGPRASKIAADTLDGIFQRSAVHELQQRGLLGPASAMSIDPAKGYQNAKQMLESRGIVLGAHSFVSDMLHAISSAPAMSLMAMNKKLPKWEQNAAIRNFSGDPAKSGAWRKADGGKGPNIGAAATSGTPWGNIALQATAQFGRNIRKNPHGAAMGIFNTIAVPAIGSVAWNATLPDYVDPQTGKKMSYSDYHFNIRTPDKVGSSIYFGVPGLPPEQGIEIDWIDPLMRPFKMAAELLAAHHLGALDSTHQNPDHAPLFDGLRALTQHQDFQNRFYTLGDNSVPKAIMNQSLLPPPHTALRIGGALLGQDVRSYGDSRAVDDKLRGGFSEGAGSNPEARLLGEHVPAQAEVMLRAIGSQAFGNILNTLVDAETRTRAGKPMGEVVRQEVNAAKMRVADSTKALGSGPLFDTFLAISPSMDASSTLVKQKLDGMQKLSDALQQSTLPGGSPQLMLGNKRIGFQDYTGTQPAGAPNLQMQQLAELATMKRKELMGNQEAQNKVLYDDIRSIRNSPEFSPEQRRAKINERALAIIDNNRAILQDLERYENVLSQQMGTPVKFDHVKLE